MRKKLPSNLRHMQCEGDLAEAIPALEAALAALNTLKPSDITIVKTMKSPPAGVRLVMAAVCVMRDIKPDKINDPAGRHCLLLPLRHNCANTSHVALEPRQQLIRTVLALCVVVVDFYQLSCPGSSVI